MKKIFNKTVKNITRLFTAAPVLAAVAIVGILLTVIGLFGRRTIYAEQEYQPLKMPVLALVLQGIDEERYPWQIWPELTNGVRYVASAILSAGTMSGGAAGSEDGGVGNSSNGTTGMVNQDMTDGTGALSDAEAGSQLSAEEGPEQSDGQSVSGNDMAVTSAGKPRYSGATASGIAGQDANRNVGGENALPKIMPLRESTYEEYVNHISADIYGTAGLERAAAYDFFPVTEAYFDDALFIGDSRTVGLRDYTPLSEHADFLCATSLSIYKVLEQNIDKKGTVAEALEGKKYGKIYLSMGINELGRGTTEDFLAQYQTVVERLRELEPEAMILIQGIMGVSKVRNDKDNIFNNSNIIARNRAIATLADNRQIFYIDANEVVSDEAGNLEEKYTYDEIHLLGVYNELIQEFLMAHGVGTAAE